MHRRRCTICHHPSQRVSRLIEAPTRSSGNAAQRAGTEVIRRRQLASRRGRSLKMHVVCSWNVVLKKAEERHRAGVLWFEATEQFA
jgi:hypothetical protein